MKLVTKKTLLLLTGAYAIFFVLLFLSSIICKSYWCRVHDNDFLGQLFFILLPLLPAFVFTLITYRMHKEVFGRWMSFAIWSTPLLMLLTYLINSGSNNGLGIAGSIGGGFDAFLFVILYGLYCLISIWLIWSEYKKVQHK